MELKLVQAFFFFENNWAITFKIQNAWIFLSQKFHLNSFNRLESCSHNLSMVQSSLGWEIIWAEEESLSLCM